jgi:hypothetical protein
MGMVPAKMGMIYTPRGLQQFIRTIGLSATKEVFFTGRLYDSTRVKELGLVDYLVPRAELESFTYTMAEEIAGGRLQPEHINETMFARYTALPNSPDPDLFIRTGGEMRISNFLLWQSAYTEFYFSPVLWPDFGPERLDEAIGAFRDRERRFGMTGEQARQRAG